MLYADDMDVYSTPRSSARAKKSTQTIKQEAPRSKFSAHCALYSFRISRSLCLTKMTRRLHSVGDRCKREDIGLWAHCHLTDISWDRLWACCWTLGHDQQWQSTSRRAPPYVHHQNWERRITAMLLMRLGCVNLNYVYLETRIAGAFEK